MYEYLDELSRVVQKVENRAKELAKLQSRYDGEREDMLHFIELGSFDAIEGWKLIKSLKSTLSERRKVKDELAIITSIQSRINADSVKKIYNKGEINKSYPFRGDILNRTLGIKVKKL